MQSIQLFDDQFYTRLLPFTYTRPVADLRIGIFTMREKWLMRSTAPQAGFLCRELLSKKFKAEESQNAILINGRLFPTAEALDAIQNLQAGDCLYDEDEQLIAIYPLHQIQEYTLEQLYNPELSKQKLKATFKPKWLKHVWDIFSLNGAEIVEDLKHLKSANSKLRNPESSYFIQNAENIWIDEDAQIEPSFIDASAGPVYIGKNAHIMQGAMLKGPLAILENSRINMGAKIYGDTTVGPHSKVGGEVSNSVFWGYANKSHDGYLGNSVIGQWCNLGADTNTSNLKNNYEEVKVWDYDSGRFLKTGLQFCGLLMGDHSKSGINTMFNTATSVGVASNIYGSGFPRTFIPSFSWGGAGGMSEHNSTKAILTAEKVMSRRGMELNDTDRTILIQIFTETQKYRL